MEPFVFAFSRGEDDAPRVMFIADVACACGLCGEPQLQRFYHSTPFHALTLGALERLARGVNAKAGYSCPNCGTPVGPGEVERGALIYGFPDDSGTLMATVDYTTGGSPRWEITPERRLDPQVQPRFTPAEGVELFDALDDTLLLELCGRVFNLKALWREVASDWSHDPEGGAHALAASGCHILIERDAASLDALAEDVLAEVDDADAFVGVALTPGGSRWVGEVDGWMPEGVLDALRAGDAYAEALISEDEVAASVRRAFEVGRLGWTEGEGADGVLFFDEIATPRGERFPEPLDLGEVIERAARTGITAGEAGRLAAEEIVGALLRVW